VHPVAAAPVLDVSVRLQGFDDYLLPRLVLGHNKE